MPIKIRVDDLGAVLK